MKQIAGWALDVCHAQGVQYAEIRIVDDRQRALATKNGKVGYVSDSESLGVGNTRARQRCLGICRHRRSDARRRRNRRRTRAGDCARVGTREAGRRSAGAGKGVSVDDWSSPCHIDPFSISIEQNLDLLMKIDAELRSVEGVTLAETNLNFRRYEQWFYNTDGSDIHQLKHDDWRRLRRVFVRRNRDPEALVSELVWRSVAEQRLRTDRRTEAGGERATHRRRSSRAAQGRSMSGRASSTSFSTRRNSDCRFTNRSDIRSNSIACSAWKPTSPARRSSRSTSCAS